MLSKPKEWLGEDNEIRAGRNSNRSTLSKVRSKMMVMEDRAKLNGGLLHLLSLIGIGVDSW